MGACGRYRNGESSQTNFGMRFANEIGIRQGKVAHKKGGLNRTEASRKYIFSGLLFCDKCGRPFIAFRTREGEVRYACDGWRMGECSNNKSILLHLIESQLLPAIAQLVCEPSVRDRLALELPRPDGLSLD